MRFRLPDPVLDVPDKERTDGAWLSETDPNSAVMMQVPGVGAFIRSLFPVQLDGGYTVTFGVWLGVEPSELQRAWRVWWEPEYTSLTFEGKLANALPTRGLLGASVTASVPDAEAAPYVTSSSDPGAAQLLTRVWPHKEVLDSLPR